LTNDAASNLKSFSKSKEIITRTKRLKTQPTKWQWETVFNNYSMDKKLISRMYEELKKLNKTTNNSVAKWSNKLNKELSEEEIKKVNKYMKKCSTALAIKEKQIKTILRFHLTPVRLEIIKKTSNKCWLGCRGKGTLSCFW
jgi:ribosomal protein S13